ncbi:MAG: twin-arginine translocase TatA/TatE family subunit [Campylobacterota bacterium]
MGMPGGMEWILIALVVLLLFGGKKIPELAKGLGSGIKNFKNAVKEDEEEEVAQTKKADELEKKDETTATTKEDEKDKTKTV